MTFLKIRRAAVLAAALASTLLPAARAASTDVNLAGWQALSGFGLAGNSEAQVNLPAGSLVTGFDYIDLIFTTTDDSWQSELVLSVNNAKVASAWLDWRPSTTDAGGIFSGSGSWAGPTGAGPVFGPGAAFVTTGPTVFVTVYLGFTVPPVGIQIGQGTLRIHYDVAAIPEPSSHALMALGLLALGAAVRRRS